MKFYVVEHSNGKFSIQTNPKGGGLLLDIPFDNKSREQANYLCGVANEALEVFKDYSGENDD